MFVITADQRGSRCSADRVPALIEQLRPWSQGNAEVIALPLERTVGDEVQILLSDAEAAVDLSIRLLRGEHWAVGIGAGSVEEPRGPSARESSGEAFYLARTAVERAKGRGEPSPVVVEGADDHAASSATAVLQLLASAVRRRSEGGQQAVALKLEGMTQTSIAAELDVSPQAVSKRLQAAMAEEELRVRPVIADLLQRAAGTAGPSR
ncbi:sigma-70 family RNA polymerase sigma factor [Nesterenkonia lacusekhoensis]|uniref:DNA-binding protein n=1 Tax=Nesterenkonia lacusekhoensis TaxID=150832 RepID=A0ABS4T0J7_9MICC|nr:sigma-70 family RNA polymerase sigma factor [Nesterenkonia lacusekhoensis]MBP2317972.1 hypothetical protein [Nesterenkonia lacusekhoensis]